MYVRLEVVRNGHTVTGRRFVRGRASYGRSGDMVGYMLTCDCGWECKVNEPKRQAASIAREHLRYDHADG